jgi:peptidoglycan-N-acetylglucosamine deacetylase
MQQDKPLASLSLDLDNQWTYLKTHGDAGWQSYPSFLDTLVPRVLEFLARLNLKITFFVVGKDIAFEKNHAPLQAICASGHEIGNHSFSHEPWLHLYSEQEIEAEIASTEKHIHELTGTRPLGFRGPGYSLSNNTLKVLAQRSYLYDASTLPTFIGPLARLYYFLKSDLNQNELQRRRSLFGSIRDGLRPLKSYRWGGADGLLEIPITTMPLLRLPIHMSYVLYLSTYSVTLALRYFRSALRACELAGVSPSLLLHPLDFLGADDGIGLDFFPGMGLNVDHKIRVVGEALERYCERFRVVSLREHAVHLLGASKTNVVKDYTSTLSGTEWPDPPPFDSRAGLRDDRRTL